MGNYESFRGKEKASRSVRKPFIVVGESQEEKREKILMAELKELYPEETITNIANFMSKIDEKYLGYAVERVNSYVYSSPCGSSKTLGILSWAAKYCKKRNTTIVCERVATLHAHKKWLIEVGKVPENIIGLYHSDQKGFIADDEIAIENVFSGTPTITLITHARIGSDCPILFTHKFGGDPTAIFIDELPNNFINQTIFNFAALKRWVDFMCEDDGYLSRMMQRALDQDYQYDINDIIASVRGALYSAFREDPNFKRLEKMSNVLIEMNDEETQMRIGGRKHLSRVNEKSSATKAFLSIFQERDNKGFEATFQAVKSIINASNLFNDKKLSIELHEKNRKIVVVNQLKIIHKMITLICAILTGSYRKLSSRVGCEQIVAVVSPAYDWSALSNGLAIILDATYRYNKAIYRPDLFQLIDQRPPDFRYPAKNFYLITSNVHIPSTKYAMEKWLSKNPKIGDQCLNLFYQSLLSKLLEQNYKKIFIVCWKDNDEYPTLKIESRLKSIIENLSEEDINRIALTYFGGSGGSNDYRDCDCAVMLGEFYLSKDYQELLSNFNFSSFEGNAENVERFNRDFCTKHYIQDICRTQLRLGKEVDIYIHLEINDDSPAIKSKTVEEFKSNFHIQKSEVLEIDIPLKEEETEDKSIAVDLRDIESSKLSKTDKAKLNALLDAYPEIREGEIVIIDSNTLCTLWNVTPEKLKRSFVRLFSKIETGTFINKVIVTKGGRSIPNTYYIKWLKS